MHFQTKVLIVSVLIVCVMAGAIGSFWYRQTSKQAQSSAERYIGSVLERLNGSFETMPRISMIFMAGKSAAAKVRSLIVTLRKIRVVDLSSAHLRCRGPITHIKEQL